MLRLFRDLGLQQDCTLCDARSSGLLCPSCRADLPRADEPACARCAIGLPVPGVCGACLQDPPAFDEAIAAFRYGFPLDRIVQALKFSRELALAGLLAEALAVAVRAHAARVDALVALPLSRARLAERGFNQAALIAQGAGRALGLPVLDGALLKVRDTPPQSGLGRAARRKNVRGAFDCDRVLGMRQVALVDDVMTTGATLDAAAGALKRAGIERVSAWVVARAATPAG